jgi:hypothetical protein
VAVIITTNFEWPDLPVAAIGRAHQKAGLAIGGEFVSEDLPRRFDGSVKRELLWTPRAVSTEKRKAKRGLAGRDHYWKGETRRRLLSGGARVIASPRAKVYRVRIVLRNLNEGYTRMPDSGRPNMRSEISRFTNEEVQRLAGNYVVALREALEEEMAKHRKTVRL